MSTEEIKKIHQFITNNFDLEKLESQTNEFNPFKILKVDKNPQGLTLNMVLK